MKQKKLILVKLIGIGDDNSNISEYNPGHVKLDWLPLPKVDRNDEDDKDGKSNNKVYKSELDYLYYDNENNVDKANNETEIIEAEEVDTSKIDWDW